MNKVAAVTFIFWVMKIAATTLGETAGDMFSMTFNLGYGLSSLILISCFVVSLCAQLKANHFIAPLFWTVILTTSTAGTTISDYMDRTLALGYATGTAILVATLMTILVTWYLSVGNLSVNSVRSKKAEVFYWMAILASNTLGTALGDFLADDSGLGFLGGALLVGALIGLICILYQFTSVNRVVLFWIAFVLTRPFGATLGDLLTKSTAKGGLNLGTVGSSAVLLSILVGLLLFTVQRAPGKLGTNSGIR